MGNMSIYTSVYRCIHNCLSVSSANSLPAFLSLSESHALILSHEKEEDEEEEEGKELPCYVQGSKHETDMLSSSRTPNTSRHT